MVWNLSASNGGPPFNVQLLQCDQRPHYSNYHWIWGGPVQLLQQQKQWKSNDMELLMVGIVEESRKEKENSEDQF